MIISDDIKASQQNPQSIGVSTSASILLSTAIGGVVRGLPGALVGFALSAVDEFLISKSTYSNHYLSTSAFWLTTALAPITSNSVNVAPNYRIPIYLCSMISSGIITTYTDDFLDYKNKIETPIGAFLTISKLFDDKNIISQNEIQKIYDKFAESIFEGTSVLANDISEIYNNQFLSAYFKSTALSLVNVVLENIFLYYLSGYSGNLFITTLINNYNTGEVSTFFQVPKVFLNQGIKIILAYSLKSFLEFYIHTIEYSLTTQQLQMILEKSTKIILEDGNGRKIMDNEEGKEIINNLTNDLFSLYYFGATKLNDIFSKSSGFLISLNTVQKFAPDGFAPYTLTIIPIQMLLRTIAEDTKELSEKRSKAQSKVWHSMNDIIENIEQITMRDGQEFVKYKYNSFLSAKTDIEQKSEYLFMFKRALTKCLIPLNQFMDIIYLGYKVISNQLDIAKAPLITSSIDNLNDFLSGNLIFQIENNDLIIAKQRIDKLLKIVSSDRNEGVIHVWSEQDDLSFKNYSLMLDDKELVKIDDLKLQYGTVYVITGKSGCGKTSALIDVKSWVSGALSSSGEISIGLVNEKKPKIMFVDQKLYLPSESTLLESIFFPNILGLLSDAEAAQLKERVIELLKELEIDEFINQNENSGILSRLDEQEFKLSGGQSKKIAIIQAIINEPDILIMDETLTGLDKKSVILVEQSLKKYLPHSMIMVVDHHAEDNNYDHFYGYEVHFENSSALLRNITSKPHADLPGMSHNTTNFEAELTINGQCNIDSFYDNYGVCH